MVFSTLSNSKDLHGILICCPSVSIRLNHSCSSSVRPHKGQGGYSGAPARPRHRRPRISMTSEMMGSKSKYFCPFMAGLTYARLLRSGDGKRRAAKLAKSRTCNWQPQLAGWRKHNGFFRVTILWFHYLSMSCPREMPWSWSVIEYPKN